MAATLNFLPKPASPILNPSHPLAQGLVFCAPLFEGAAAPRDISASAHGAGTVITMNATTPLWQNGPVGYSLNGSAGSGYGFTPKPNLTSMTNVTVGGWMMATAGGTISDAIAMDDAGANRNWGIGIPAANQWRFRYQTGGTQNNVASATNFSANVWHHVYGTYDGSTGKLYVDGELTASLTTNTTMNTTAPSLAIGIRSNGFSQFPGNIANASVWNRALSADEIKQLFQDEYVFMRNFALPLKTSAAPPAFKSRLGLLGVG